MKRTLILMAAAMLLALPVKAQWGALINQSISVYSHGQVNFKDGHQEQYLWVELPKIGATKVKVTNDPKKKKPTELNAEDIESLTFWTDKHPDDLFTLYYVHADKSKLPLSGMVQQDAWGYPLAGSAWGVIIKCHAFYDVDKKSDEIVLGSYRDQFGEREPVCYLVCKDFKNAQFIGVSGSMPKQRNVIRFAAPPKHIAPFFKSNPEIEKKILNKKLDGKDIQYILDEMAAYHGLNEVVDAPAPTTENKSENGQVGDDE